MTEICSSNWRHHLKGSCRCDQSMLALMASDFTMPVVCFSPLPYMKTSEKKSFSQVFLGITTKGNVTSDGSLQRNPLWKRVSLWRGMDKNIFCRKNIML